MPEEDLRPDATLMPRFEIASNPQIKLRDIKIRVSGLSAVVRDDIRKMQKTLKAGGKVIFIFKKVQANG